MVARGERREDTCPAGASAVDTAGRDPYPFYARRRSEGPIVWDAGMRAWLVLSHEHCTHVERNEDLFAAGYAHHEGADEIRGRRSLLTVTGREHRLLHEFFSAELSSKALEPRRAAIRRTIDAHLDRIAPLGRAELDRDFAERVPIAVVAELLGFSSDEASLARCRQAMVVLLAWFESAGESPELVEGARGAIRELEDVIRPAVLERRAEPRDDLISRLWEFGPTVYEDWNEVDVVDQCKAIFQAGSVTTQDLVCSLAYRLLVDGELRTRVVADGDAVPALVEETLRRENPVQLRMRVATGDAELGGVSIRAGERLYVVNAAANRDPARYERPDELDLGRRGIYSHLAFNVGPRLCVGRWLARIEAAAAVQALLERLPNLRLDPDAEPPEFQRFMFRAYRPLHVLFDA